MRRSDLSLLIVVAIVSVIFSVLISNFVITAPKNRQHKAQVVQKISNDYTSVDGRYFNAQSIDPTKLIKIGEDGNTDPFMR